MSNAGQAGLAIAGAVVGVLLAPATGGLSTALLWGLYGSQIGLLAGSFLFPTQLPNAYGPRLTDHQTTSSALGDPVVIGYGVFPSSGTVIFLDAVVEHATTTKQGGKGAPQQKSTTYSYTQSIAIGLCETTSMLGVNNPILGIQRIWENGELVYDTRAIQPGETTSSHGHDSSIGTYQQRLEANAKYADTFVLYLGTEDQPPDPTIELQQGVGTTPPYRGLAYIVYPDRLLRTDQGVRHPTFKFEIEASGTTAPTIIDPTFLLGAHHDLIQIDVIALDLANGRYFIWNVTIGLGNDTLLAFSLPTNEQYAETTSLPSFAPLGGVGLAISPEPNGELMAIWAISGSFATLARIDPVALTVDGSVTVGVAGARWMMYGTQTVNFGAGPVYLLAAVSIFARVTVYNCVTLAQMVQYTYTDHPSMAAGLLEAGTAVFWVASNTPSAGPTGGNVAIHKIVIASSSNSNTLTTTFTPADIDPLWTYIQTKGDMIVDPSDGHVLLRIKGNGSGATHTVYLVKFNGDTGAIDWATPLTLGANYDYATNQSHISGNTWWLSDQIGIQSYATVDLTTGVVTPVSLAAIPGMATIEGASVTSASYQGGALLLNFVAPHTGWSLVLPALSTPGNALIGDIVADLCERSGLTDHDTDSLGDETVEGFVIAATPMTARDAIVPLRSVGFFDSVESGDTLKFVKRGAAAALTLGVHDIGAVESETSDDPPAANIVSIAMESDLPQQVRMSYMSPARNYQVGQQLSPVRFDTLSQNIADVQLGGICITDDQAAQTVEILWNDAWESDHSFTFAVDQAFAALEPTDVVLLPLQGTLFRVRITAIDDASQVLRSITAITDDDGNYVSTAVAQTQPVITTMKFNAESTLILMDAPLLLDADDTARVSAPMYSAVYPLGTDSWIGAGIFESPDGSTYANIATATNKADVGLATTALGDTTDPFVTDTVNSVTVQMSDASSLPSTITDAALLAGGNVAALIDEDGAIEIFQFRDVTVESADTVTLSYLVRGRRGSESMTGNHDVGGRFVMLTTGTIQKEALNLSDLTATLQWKAVGSNDAIDAVAAVPFASSGRSLMPRAPWNTRTTLAGSDILIMADRRSRIENNSSIGFASPTLPLNEDSEAYEVDVYDAPGTSVLRTLTGTALPITYTAAEVVADFGSTPADLWLAVYQMSGQVGRGFTHKVNVGVPT